MKLIQLNVWWGGKLDGPLSKFLADEAPDILCLQEAASYSKNSDTGMMLPIERMKDIAKLEYGSFAPLHTINFMNSKLSFGNAILSRQPIVTEHYFYTNLKHVDNFDFGVHDYNVRNLLHCQIKNNGATIHLLTHHGHHIPGHKNGDENTLRQMQEIANYIDTLSGPIILTGDFNLAPHSKSIKIIDKKLVNLSTKYDLKTTRNALTYKKEVCDYIFVNDEVKVGSFMASDATVSDHKALILEFEI